MSDSFADFAVQRNAKTATREELVPLSFAGYAHFTAMQARGRKIRALDLHLKRLRLASMKLFGQALPDEKIQAYLRTALQVGPEDVSLMATVYSPAGEFVVAGADDVPEVLIRTAPAATGPQGPLRLMAVEYERVLPEVKHVGEIAKTYYLRQAVENGFDDAAFIDRHGRLSEGSIWNLAFWDGSAVIWPVADMLLGTTMAILQRQLQHLDIPQRSQEITLNNLPDLVGAVVMNSWTPGVAVHQIGSVTLPPAPEFLEIVHKAYQIEPFVSP